MKQLVKQRDGGVQKHLRTEARKPTQIATDVLRLPVRTKCCVHTPLRADQRNDQCEDSCDGSRIATGLPFDSPESHRLFKIGGDWLAPTRALAGGGL